MNRFKPTVQGRARAQLLRGHLGIAHNVPVVGVVGRLVWEKGYGDLFAAVKRLRAMGRNSFEVVVVGPSEPGKGDAVDRGAIEAMRGEGVRFLGQRNDITSLLQLFDVFILPSRREGFPRAAMEACAMGVPVVATDIRGCRQVVAHGHNGFLYSVGAVDELVDRIRRCLDDSTMRARFGTAGIELARSQFDQQRVIDRTVAVYRRLLRKRGLAQLVPAARTDRYSTSIDLVDDVASKSSAAAAAELPIL